jgi:glutamine synthetase
MSCFCDVDGGTIPECARCFMKTLSKSLSDRHSIDLLVGFEIECVFLRRRPENERDPYEPLTKTHAWGTLSADQWTNLLPLAMEIHDALQGIGIQIQAMHPESAPGQYEFILPPLAPVDAVDTLYQARQCIAMVAEQHGLRATLHPMPFPGAGSGAHAHVSLNSEQLSTSDLEQKGKHFSAEVLAHMEALCAFSLSETESYTRVAENSWTSGTWVAWGTQNREVPLRKSARNRWEVRVIDGFANMYLVLGAVMAAGLRGLDSETEEVIGDCPGESLNPVLDCASCPHH